jgi:hypothetical protein
MSERKKLREVTWVLGDKPCRTFKLQTGCWADVTNTNSVTGKKGGATPPAIVSRLAF